MKLSDNLKKIRKENNLSQEQLAEKLGVSRQAVSKWESGQSYPEMDKVLLICKLFNYNIDELMNENVKEVDEIKQGKLNINKYIDDFFAFITKTVDMLSSMSFKQRLNVLSEQIIICIFLVCIFAILGAICSSIIFGLIGGISNEAYYNIRGILKAIYLFFALIIGIIILLHIFKVRYLDYYEIVREDKTIEKNNTDDNKVDSEQHLDDDDKKIVLEKQKEKVIIRDPEHSQSKFLTGIANIIIWFIKIMAIWFIIGFSVLFIFLTILLILNFLFIKTGLLFVGALLGILSALVINFIILSLFYHFIINKKVNKHYMAISFLLALLLCGVGMGLMLISLTNFNYVEDLEENSIVKDVYEIPINDTLTIDSFYNHIEYVETDLTNVKVEVQHSEYYYTKFSNDNGIVNILCLEDSTKVMDRVRETIKDINNGQIKNYNNPTIVVYASKDNIAIIKQNINLNYRNIGYTADLEHRLSMLQEDVERKDEEIKVLNEKLIEKDTEISILQKKINNID